MLIKSAMGIELGGSVSAPHMDQCIEYVEVGTDISVEFEFKCMLNTGAYFLNAGVQGATDVDLIYLHRILDVCMFRVLPDTENMATGMVDFSCVPTWLVATQQKSKVSG
jgi:lipopolysaccharide transport system ATP-binding protein